MTKRSYTEAVLQGVQNAEAGKALHLGCTFSETLLTACSAASPTSVILPNFSKHPLSLLNVGSAQACSGYASTCQCVRMYRRLPHNGAASVEH